MYLCLSKLLWYWAMGSFTVESNANGNNMFRCNVRSCPSPSQRLTTYTGMVGSGFLMLHMARIPTCQQVCAFLSALQALPTPGHRLQAQLRAPEGHSVPWFFWKPSSSPPGQSDMSFSDASEGPSHILLNNVFHVPMISGSRAHQLLVLVDIQTSCRKNCTLLCGVLYSYMRRLTGEQIFSNYIFGLPQGSSSYQGACD